jgi:hypothetical protein
MRYLSEELARAAIADGTLTIIHEFLSEPVANQNLGAHQYVLSAVEDIDGPIADMAISRYKGERFSLTSKISAVAGLCRNFDRNLYNYYVLPGQSIAKALVELLVNVADVVEPDDVPRLYFGEIVRSRNAGITPKPTNLRMTALRCHANVQDFYIKAIDADQTRKAITDDSQGRYVLFWGKVTVNGIGLCVARPKWGEYALLPKQYDHLLS